MIAYDDLVAALATWRARQGLPVASTAASAGAPPPAPRAVAAPPTPPAPAPRAVAAPPAPAPRPEPPRAARPGPPAAPPPRVTPLPLPAPAVDDFDDDGLVEAAHYDANGDDYIVPLGDIPIEPTGERTAIEATPQTDAQSRRGKRHDW